MNLSDPSPAISPETLDSNAYLAAHEAFRAHSNQREMVLEWCEAGGLLDIDTPAPSVLAVGAGGGHMDLPMIAELAERGAFSYDAIDPSRVALERFQGRCETMAAADARRIWFHKGEFESFEPGHRYDLIHFIHAIYSLDDLEAGVAKAHRLLEDGGRLVIVCSTDEGVNRFKRDALAAIGQPIEGGTVPEEELLAALAKLEGGGMEISVIPSKINVEPSLSRTFEGEKVLSFFLQSDFGALDVASQHEVIQALDRHSMGEEGERFIAQPMLGIVLQKQPAVAGRRVGLKVSNSRQLDDLADVAVFA